MNEEFDEGAELARTFAAHRGHLRAVAQRMLGSASEADDALQEAWLRLSRGDTAHVHNLGGFFTTVVARVCLDLLRTRKSRREELVDATRADAFEQGLHPIGADDTQLAAALGPALLVVLETLPPAERLAFVLHDLFGLPFEEIAVVVRRSPAATRQLASRGRRRVRGRGGSREEDDAAALEAETTRERGVVEAFLRATREGHFETLIALLDGDAVVRPDEAAIARGAKREVRGAEAVARAFLAHRTIARNVTLDGGAGAIVESAGAVVLAFGFTFRDGKIHEVEIIADLQTLSRIEIDLVQTL